jgi:hypothetical protein
MATGDAGPAIQRGLEFLLDHDGVRADPVKYRSTMTVDRVQGLGVQIDDLSGIPLIEQLPVAAALQLRARMRAQSGDVVLSNLEPPRGYEAYNQDRLGLGHATWLQPNCEKGSMTVTRDCLASTECLDVLAGLLSGRGGYVHPYVSFEDVWLLAQELAGRSGSKVSVVGPPPALAALVNNKCRFLDFARAAAGYYTTIPFAVANSAAALADLLRQFASRSDRLVVRLPHSAGGLGTTVVDAGSFSPEKDPLAEAGAMLAALGWDGRTDVLVSEWVPALTSVSTQIWIPPERLGGPVCEGVYEQRLDPTIGMQFWGAVPVQLPDEVDAELRRLSGVTCEALQLAGYVGRCSFDFLLVGERLESATPLFVECNGRWGGVSSVMSLVDRVSAPGKRLAHSFGPVVRDSLRGAEFGDILDVLEPELYELRTGVRGALLYNVGGLATGRIDICTIDVDQDSAARLWETCAQRLQTAADGGGPDAATG